MASRRVRFADNSPFSNASTLSSPGPSTPPVLTQPPVWVYQTSPYYMLSPALPAPWEIHSILSMPMFDFNVSIDPALNPVVHGNSLVTQVRNEPATCPPVPSLTLVSRPLPWEIVISYSFSPFVTVADVLGGLYRALRMRATEQEFYREGREKQGAITQAYHRRYRRALGVELEERERREGLKRIDFLVGSHFFKGLRKTERYNVWNIKFEP